MYHGCGEFAVVKRFGRWSTDVVHDYLWEYHENQKGLAEAMVEADFELPAPTTKPMIKCLRFTGDDELPGKLTKCVEKVEGSP